MIKEGEVISVPGVGGRKSREIGRRYLCEIIEARAEEILRIVAEELEQLDVLKGFRVGLFLRAELQISGEL